LGAVNIALDGLIPFSRVPVRMIFVLGSVIFVLGLLGSVTCFSWRLATGLPQHWFLMIILSQFILGGMGIAALGIVGEYVVRTYEETRRRPQYVIESIVTSKKSERRKMYGMKGTVT
jgi:dolichol-phosphate mannosyltransferase